MSVRSKQWFAAKIDVKAAIITPLPIVTPPLPFLLPLVYGPAFADAVSLAILLLPGVTLAGLGDIINQDMRGQGKPIAGVAARVLGLIVIAGIGSSLVGRLGAHGIAIGFLAGETISFVGLLIVALRYYQDACFAELLPNKADWYFLRQKILRIGAIAK